MGSLKYIKSFDGHRGVFCVLIIWQHIHFKNLYLPFVLAWPSLQIFFVLSGYLICKILINQKNKGISGKAYAKTFYVRRAYRIFPLYFIFILFLFFLAQFFTDSQFVQLSRIDEEFKQNGWMLFTYFYNFKEMFNLMLNQPYQISGLTVHLWSLSLEEQFYMIIPLLIFVLTSKNLKRTFISIIVVVQILRAVVYFYLTAQPDIPQDAVIYMLHRNFFFQADSLAMGGLLATLNLNTVKNAKTKFYILLLVFLIVNIAISVSATIKEQVHYRAIIDTHQYLRYGYQIVYMYFLVNVMFAYMIICSIQGKPVAKWLFENRLIVFLGKISYSMYVWQFVVIFSVALLIAQVKPNFNLRGSFQKEAVMLVIIMSACIAVGYLSYRLIELPFLKLKDRKKD